MGKKKKGSIFKEWDIFGHQKAKIQKFHQVSWLDFSKILFEDRISKESKSDCVFIFNDDFDYSQTTFPWKFSGKKLVCFIVLVLLLYFSW